MVHGFLTYMLIVYSTKEYASCTSDFLISAIVISMKYKQFIKTRDTYPINSGSKYIWHLCMTLKANIYPIWLCLEVKLYPICIIYWSLTQLLHHSYIFQCNIISIVYFWTISIMTTYISNCCALFSSIFPNIFSTNTIIGSIESKVSVKYLENKPSTYILSII